MRKMNQKEDTAKLSGRTSSRTTSSLSTLLSWMATDADTKSTQNICDDICPDPDRDSSDSRALLKDSSSIPLDYLIKLEVEECEDEFTAQPDVEDDVQFGYDSISMTQNEATFARVNTVEAADEAIDIDDSEGEIDIEDVDEHEEINQAQVLLSKMGSSETTPSTSCAAVATSFSHKCGHCWKSFKARKKFHDHLLSEHGIKTYECHICQKICRTRTFLEKHVRGHQVKKMYSCYICDKRWMTTRWALQLHFRTVHGTKTPLVFQCQVCKKRFISETLLKSHQTIHTGTQPYECDICHRRFVRKRSLMSHKVKVHVSKRRKVDNVQQAVKVAATLTECRICKLNFQSYSSLHRHIKTHSKSETSFKCPMCGLFFTGLLSLNTHLRLHREGKLKELEEIVESRGEETESNSVWEKEPSVLSSAHPFPHAGMKGTLYECDLCGTTVKTLWRLRDHRRKHTGTGLYHCETCDLSFSRRGQWAEHNKIHYVCQHCERRFSFQSQLDNHIRVVHVKEKGICEICGKRVRCLPEHKYRVHGDRPRLKQIQCPDCLRRLTTEESLKAHKLFHENQGKCTECGKQFNGPFKLKQHLQWQHGNPYQFSKPEKSYLCDICSKGYRCPKLLKEHQIAVHEKVRNHQCEHCGKKYFYDSNVRYHQKFSGCGKKGRKARQDTKKQPQKLTVEDTDDSDYSP